MHRLHESLSERIMKQHFEVLSEGLEFDLWANRRWFGYLQSQGWPEPDRTIFQHVMAAQDVWQQRCFGGSPTAMPVFEPTEGKLVDLHEGWQKILVAREDDPLIHFHRITGEAGHLRLSQIIGHVIDHGTYHRGELRGLCRGRGLEDFPETGLAMYYSTLTAPA